MVDVAIGTPVPASNAKVVAYPVPDAAASSDSPDEAGRIVPTDAALRENQRLTGLTDVELQQWWTSHFQGCAQTPSTRCCGGCTRRAAQICACSTSKPTGASTTVLQYRWHVSCPAPAPLSSAWI